MKLNKSKNINKIIKPWRVERSKYVLVDRWIKVRADDCITNDGTKIAPYYVLEYPNWVHMVVVNKKGQVLITEQYRHGVGKVGYELPCGTVDPEDKTPLIAAKRELLEETGFGGNFVLVGKVHPNPANHANNIFVFLVINPIQRCLTKEDSIEVINYKFIDQKSIWKMIDQRQFQQGLHITSLVLGLRKNKSLQSRL